MIAGKKRNQINQKTGRSESKLYKRPNVIAIALFLLAIAIMPIITKLVYQDSSIVVGEILSKKYVTRKYSKYSRSCTINCLCNDTCLVFFVPVDYYNKAKPGDYVEIIVSNTHNDYRLNKKKYPYRHLNDTSSFVNSELAN